MSLDGDGCVGAGVWSIGRVGAVEIVNMLDMVVSAPIVERLANKVDSLDGVGNKRPENSTSTLSSAYIGYPMPPGIRNSSGDGLGKGATIGVPDASPRSPGSGLLALELHREWARPSRDA